MNSITQDMMFRQSLMKYSQKYGVNRASRKYNKARSYIYFWLRRWDGTLQSLAAHSKRPHHHTAIDEFTRLRFLYGYEEQSTYSSADFAKRLVEWYKRRGIKVECIQTDNGFEFTNRFSPGKKNKQTLFEATLEKLGIKHKLIRPYTPRHNGKVERSHREDHNKFYKCHSFYSCADLNVQLAARLKRTNDRPMRPLNWLSPIEFFNDYLVQDH